MKNVIILPDKLCLIWVISLTKLYIKKYFDHWLQYPTTLYVERTIMKKITI